MQIAEGSRPHGAGGERRMTEWTELCRMHHRTETIITEELRPLVSDRVKHVLRDIIIGSDGRIVDIKYVVLD